MLTPKNALNEYYNGSYNNCGYDMEFKCKRCNSYIDVDKITTLDIFACHSCGYSYTKLYPDELGKDVIIDIHKFLNKSHFGTKDNYGNLFIE